MDTKDTMMLIAIGSLQLGVIVLAVSVPLMLRRVPMNRSFGFRIPAAFESDQRWYDINAFGGRWLAIGSLFIIAAGVAGFVVSPSHFDAYAYGSVANVVLAVGIPIVLTLIWSQRRG